MDLLEKIQKVKIYQLKDISLLSHTDIYYNSDINSIKVNGINLSELEVTYMRSTRMIPGKVESITIVSKEKTNERWELKNEKLYNKKIPMVIDTNNKDEYQDLIQENLYEYKYDLVDREIEAPIPEITFIDDEIPFMETTYKYQKYDRFGNGKHYKPFLITMLEFHEVDKCLYPKPLLDLTRPVLMHPTEMFIVLTDYIASLGNTNYRIASLSDSVFDVVDNVKRNRIIRFENYTYDSGVRSKRTFQEDYYAKNYKDMINKIKSLGNKINKLLESREPEKIKDLIFLFREDNSYPKK